MTIKELPLKTSVCTNYESLLEECQEAWKSWNSQRAAIHNSGLNGRDIDNELRNLQATYARAYSRLRNHLYSCETCEMVSRMEAAAAHLPTGMEWERRAYA